MALFIKVISQGEWTVELDSSLTIKLYNCFPLASIISSALRLKTKMAGVWLSWATLATNMEYSIFCDVNGLGDILSFIWTLDVSIFHPPNHESRSLTSFSATRKSECSSFIVCTAFRICWPWSWRVLAVLSNVACESYVSFRRSLFWLWSLELL